MIKLKDSQVAQILPEYLSERASVQALSFALYRAVERLIGYCGNISVFAVIDMAPDYVLDMLALDLNTQYYDDSIPIESKRKLIKNTMVWYMSAGTPQAVEELVAAVFGEGKVEEWFEYGDEPYYFKITTNAQMTPEMNAQFSLMLRRVKNARSHIRAIEIHRTIEQTLYSGACAFSRYKPPAIIDGYEVSRNAAGTVYAGIADGVQMRPAAILDGFSAEGGQIQGYIHSGAAVAATAKNPAVMENLTDIAEAVMGAFYSGTAQAVSSYKMPAIWEGLSDKGQVTENYYSGAAQTAHQKPPAIIDGFSETAKAVTQANTAGTAADSKYKNIIEDRR